VSLGLLDGSWALADLEDCGEAELLVLCNLSVCPPWRERQGLDRASFVIRGMLVFGGWHCI